MGILERIEAKLDQLLAAQGSGQAVDLNSFTTPDVGTAPQAAPSSAAAGDIELDKAGFPWDARIHSRSKEKVAAGTWKYKRSVEQDVKDGIENEMRAAGYGNQLPQTDAAPAQTVGTAPAVDAPVPSAPVAEVPAAPAAGAGVTLPGLSLPQAPAPVATPEPVKVVMPPYSEGAELDDSQVTAVAAAAYAKLGADAFTKLQQLFKMEPGATITDLPAQYRDSFHRIVSDDALLAHYQIV